MPNNDVSFIHILTFYFLKTSFQFLGSNAKINGMQRESLQSMEEILLSKKKQLTRKPKYFKYRSPKCMGKSCDNYLKKGDDPERFTDVVHIVVITI